MHYAVSAFAGIEAYGFTPAEIDAQKLESIKGAEMTALRGDYHGRKKVLIEPGLLADLCGMARRDLARQIEEREQREQASQGADT